MQHFHWLYRNQRYDNKIKALHDAQGDLSKIHYYFMDRELDKCSFDNEPTESWTGMCQRRCRQLRQKYDYLCLWFSGGWDSVEMLWAFAESQTRLDEIFLFHRSYFDTDGEMPPAREFAQGMIDRFFPGCKLTVIDIDWRWALDFYKQSQDDWLLDRFALQRFSKNHRGFLWDNHPHFLNHRINFSGTTCNIHGNDKPKLHIWQENWCAFQTDITLQLIIGASDFELFYFTPEMPELYIKQCHMAANWFETIPGFTHELVHDIQSSTNKTWYASWNRAVGRRHACDELNAVGNMKTKSAEQGLNLETQKIREHSEKDYSILYRKWEGQLIEVGRHIGLDLFNKPLPTTLSKSYTLRPVKHGLI